MRKRYAIPLPALSRAASALIPIAMRLMAPKQAIKLRKNQIPGQYRHGGTAGEPEKDDGTVEMTVHLARTMRLSRSATTDLCCHGL